MNSLMEQVEESHKDVQPEIHQDYKDLKSMIKQQRIENEAIQRLYEKERVKTEEQRNMVTLCSERILRMEEQVGLIADNPNYKIDALERHHERDAFQYVSMPGSEEVQREFNKTQTFQKPQGIVDREDSSPLAHNIRVVNSDLLRDSRTDVCDDSIISNHRNNETA